MIKDIFYNNKYDNRTLIINGDEAYTCGDLKQIIAGETEFLKDKSKNIVIYGNNNFNFIILFFASIFCNKNIYLITDKKIIQNFESEYYLVKDITKCRKNDYKFPEIDFERDTIHFYTSGSTGEPKIIKKSFFNLICEAKDLDKSFHFKDNTVVSSTSMTHLFGLTFHLMMPLCNGLIINTQNISYPEDINKENLIFVSTPAFLHTIPKHNLQFNIPPECIITAGSKLEEKVFEYLEKKSNIIEIYGSTETGIIAYKRHFNSPFKIFENVKVESKEECTQIISNYFSGNCVEINDKVEIKNNELYIKNRTDRMIKIYEKRVSVPALENRIKESEFVEDCYVFKNSEKPVCICALSQSGKDFIIKNSPAKLTKIIKKFTAENFEIIPQKWKYIDEIPMTDSGKINKNIIEDMFNTNLSLPVILNRDIKHNKIIYQIFFHKSCNFFRGHFLEYKIVPGVVQLFLAKEIGNNHFNLNLAPGQWKRIKFSNIIKPDKIINLKLEKNERSVTYEYYDDVQKYSSGVFLCENIFKG